MSAKYQFIQESDGVFTLYECGAEVARFRRESFREVLSKQGRSSNWVGSILRLFLKKFPVPFPVSVRSDLDRLYDALGDEGLAEYLRSKGFRVVKSIKVPDMQIVQFLETKGYTIEGLLNDAYYFTKENRLSKDCTLVNNKTQVAAISSPIE